mmetsp:Transcript_6213/g.20406  ORF Transcript_6213/g.20406 Transcript_6213/m.20406 type:complete len:90 (+) Transcript_6213:43-312(+)
MPQITLRPNLYRMVRVVMSDGATFRMPSAVRVVGDTLQLERDPHNHPVYLGEGDGAGMLNKREAARLQRIREREHRRGIGPAVASDTPP